MTVTAESPHHHEHEGRAYYFCSERCRAKFAAEPRQYLKSDAAAVSSPAELAPASVYTCPMHPEIRQDHSGNCPKCGMALEPVMPSLEEDDNPELADFQTCGR
ncbi:MAG TPA: heavy metal-binding domain-containing protein [Polyangiaceae bacterium]|nr:heavy metal-binding domain-containing protein [Polyangiaceae bacterium]